MIVLTFTGVDGSGKSSLINKITAFLNRSNTNKIRYIHLYPKLADFYLFRPPSTNSVSNLNIPYQKPVYSTLKSSLKLLYLSFLTWIYFVFIFLVDRKSIIIFDRYLYDIIIDPERARIRFNHIVLRLFVFFIPSFPISFFLNGSPSSLAKRKSEQTREQIVNIYIRYNRLLRSQDLIIIDTVQNTPSEAFAEIIRRSSLDSYV